MNLKINVLGTEYTIQIVPPTHESLHNDLDGVCDWSSKTIFVSDCSNVNFDNIPEYVKAVKRHEIIHAFLNESGLASSWEHKPTGHEETVVDWMALQFPKMIKAFEAADAL